jgi:hypothetical protein
MGKNSIFTSNETQHISIIKDQRVIMMLHKEIITMYSENYTKLINTLWQNSELLNVKAGGTCRYHWFLRGLSDISEGMCIIIILCLSV